MSDRKTAHATFVIERSFAATFRDIVPGERIVYEYGMQVNDTPISVSLATVEFRPKGKGAAMKFTEQAAFLDDFDDAGGRERGTNLLIDNLEAALRLEAP